jgi:hypothetical protein
LRYGGAAAQALLQQLQQLFPTQMPMMPAVGLAAQALLQQQHQQLSLQQLGLQQQMGLQQQFFPM